MAEIIQQLGPLVGLLVIAVVALWRERAASRKAREAEIVRLREENAALHAEIVRLAVSEGQTAQRTAAAIERSTEVDELALRTMGIFREPTR